MFGQIALTIIAQNEMIVAELVDTLHAIGYVGVVYESIGEVLADLSAGKGIAVLNFSSHNLQHISRGVEDLCSTLGTCAVVVLEDADRGDARRLFLAGAQDVVTRMDVNKTMVDSWIKKCANNPKNVLGDIRGYEAAIMRGSLLEDSLADGYLPTYYKNNNRVEYLRADITAVGELMSDWRHAIVREWIKEFGGNASFVFLKPNKFLGLRVGAMVNIDEENRPIFLGRLSDRLGRFFRSIERFGCVSVACSCNAEYMDYYVANALDSQNEQLFYAKRSQYINSRKVRASFTVDESQYERFGAALSEGRISTAVSLLDETVDALCSSRPALSYAYEVMSNFTRVNAAVMKLESGAFPSLPMCSTSIHVLRDHIVEQVFRASARLARHDDNETRSQYKIGNLVESIRANPIHSYDAEETASQLGYSRSHFCRVFSANVGESFGTFVRRQKLKYAAELLQKTTFSTKEVGNMIGYPNTWYFRKIFAQEFGCTPEQYHLRH